MSGDDENAPPARPADWLETLLRSAARTMEECARADVLVCGPVSHFSDDVRTLCALCACAVYYRPYMPRAPVRVCLPCFLQMELGGEN